MQLASVDGGPRRISSCCALFLPFPHDGSRYPLCVPSIPMRSSIKRTLLRVRRRCLVCDHEAELEEPEDTFSLGSPCPACSAPTERIEVLARRSAPAQRNPHAAALGRLGGLKGGPARAAALSAARRRDIARHAALKRWARERKKS